jgi:hypothetical protein
MAKPKMVKRELDQQIANLVATMDFTGQPLYPDVQAFGTGEDERIEDAVSTRNPCESGRFCMRRDL